MAKQRINPEGAPERFMQPVASPVDMFYRPQPNDFLKIAQGLGSLVPGLARLSDSIIESIAKREGVEGAIEGERLAGLPDAKGEVRQQKVARAIEDSGGLNPWRAQSLLESYGRNTVLQQYSRRLEQEFEDLSNPLDANGQLRPADYPQKRMAEIYAEASTAIPQNSYYARKAAEATRSEIDPVFLYKVGQAYVKKTKEEHERQFVNEAVNALENGGYQAFKEAIPELSNRYYRETGRSGNELVAAALVTQAKIRARQGDVGAAVFIQEVLDEGIDGRPVDATIRAVLEEAIDVVGKIEEQSIATSATKEAKVIDGVMGALYERLETAEDIPVGPELVSMVDGLIKDNVPAGMVAAVRGELLKKGREYAAALGQSRMGVSEMQADPEYALNLRQRLERMTPEQRIPALIEEWKAGRITKSQLGSLVEYADGLNDIPKEFDLHLKSTLDGTVNGLAWTGINSQLISPDKRPALEEVEVGIRQDVVNEAMRLSRDPELRAIQDPLMRSMEMNRQLSKFVTERVATAREQSKDILGKADRSTFYPNVMKTRVDGTDIPDAIEMITAEMGLELQDPLSGGRNPDYLKVAQRVRTEYAARAREWFDTQIESGLGTDEIMNAWDNGGSTEVLDTVREQFGSLDSLRKMKLESVVPPNRMQAMQVREQGYDRAKKADAALVSLAEPGLQAPMASGWFERMFDSNLDQDSRLSDAMTAAQEYKKAATPESEQRLDVALTALNRSAFANIDRLRMGQTIDNNVRFTETGVMTFGLMKSPGQSRMNPDALIAFGWSSDQGMTRSYWASKMIVGYSKAERDSGRTAEGLALATAQWNPNVFKLFVDQADLDRAIDTGEIYAVYQKVQDLGYKVNSVSDLINLQAELIAGRTPKPKTTGAGTEQ